MRGSIWLLGLGFLLGCQASVQAKANVEGQGQAAADGEVDFDKEGNRAQDPGFVADEAPELGASSREPTLLGARHGLRLAKTDSPQCSCLAVAVGEPASSRFVWDSTPPVIDPNSQLVIALSSEGLDCPNAPKDSLGGSYWGYQRRNLDVVVFVEPAKFGRPIASGAIIPKPSGGGRVIVRPTLPNGAYGRAMDNGGRDCVVWVPPAAPNP